MWAASNQSSRLLRARPGADRGARHPHPRPGAGAADMSQLHRAAHGVTSPAVNALCHQTYDR